MIWLLCWRAWETHDGQWLAEKCGAPVMVNVDRVVSIDPVSDGGVSMVTDESGQHFYLPGDMYRVTSEIARAAENRTGAQYVDTRE